MVLLDTNIQVFQPWIQRRRLAFAKHKHVISGILRHLRQRALGRLLDDTGEPNIDVIKKLVFVSSNLWLLTHSPFHLKKKSMFHDICCHLSDSLKVTVFL